MKLGRGHRDRPSPGDPIGGWCEHCGAAYAVGAEHCPECHAGVPFTSAPPTFSVPEPTSDVVDDDPVGRWCPSCGSSFRPGITMCPDCGEVLTAEQPRPPESPVAIRDDQRHDIVEYELPDWTWRKASELSTQLELSHIAFEWQGTTLRVPGAHEAEVDELVDILDGADDAELEHNAIVEVEEGPDVVEYEFTDWTLEQRDELVASLRKLGLDFEWDGVVLAVNGEDEDTIDGVVVRIDPAFPVEDDPS